jgi:hypothetical protein
MNSTNTNIAMATKPDPADIINIRISLTRPSPTTRTNQLLSRRIDVIADDLSNSRNRTHPTRSLRDTGLTIQITLDRQRNQRIQRQTSLFSSINNPILENTIHPNQHRRVPTRNTTNGARPPPQTLRHNKSPMVSLSDSL